MMSLARSAGSVFRLVCAFVVAPFVAALGLAVYGVIAALVLHEDMLLAVPMALIALIGFGYLPTLIFGLPALLLLRSRGRLAFRHFVVAGTILGAVPYGVFAVVLPLIFYWQRVSGGPLYIMISALPAIFLAAGLGALGGVAFWYVAYWRGPQPAGNQPDGA